MQVTTRALTPHPSTVSARVGRQEYAEAREQFLVAEDRYEKASSRNESVGLALAVGLGIAAVVVAANILPGGTTGYWPDALPWVLPGFATGGVTYGAARWVLSRSDVTQDLVQARSEFAQARDAYRGSLLAELNDEGVTASHEPVWTALKQEEKLDAAGARPVDGRLLQAVDDLELLADNRQAGGWRQALAQAQDDPHAFPEDLAIVIGKPAIRRALEGSVAG